MCVVVPGLFACAIVQGRAAAGAIATLVCAPFVASLLVHVRPVLVVDADAVTLRQAWRRARIPIDQITDVRVERDRSTHDEARGVLVLRDGARVPIPRTAVVADDPEEARAASLERVATVRAVWAHNQSSDRGS